MTAKRKTTATKRKTIPAALREGIDASGKTANQLAQETGVSHTVIGRFMRGERDLRLESAEKIAAAVGLSCVLTAPPGPDGATGGKSTSHKR